MRFFVKITAVLMVGLLMFGCASTSTSNRDEILARLLAEKPSEGVAYAGADAPEQPSSALPIPPQTNAGEYGGKTEITIQPDCLLLVKTKEDKSLDGSFPVNEIGAIELGYVGPVILYNMTEAQAAAKIKGVLENRYFKKATVEVRIIRASYDKIQVSGAVNNGGLVRIGSGDRISLNDALRRAGGLKVSVTGAKIRIVRDGLKSVVAPQLEGEEYTLLTEDGKPSVPDVSLDNNDIVYVFSSTEESTGEIGEKLIMVLGEVSRPGVYRFSTAEPCTLLHLILKMGGLPEYANPKGVRIIKTDKNGNEEEIKVNAEKILEDGNPNDDVTLDNGDRVIIPPRKLSLF